MSEGEKMQFKAVDVSLDAEGNAVVKEIEPTPKAKETQEESQEQESEQEETQDESSEQEETQENDSSEETEESDDSGTEDEDSTSEEEQETESEQEESQEDIEEEEVVDYEELPESVQKYLEFQKETGGSLKDFLEINQDFDALPQDDVIRKYLKKTNPYLDSDDIEYEIESRFKIDEADSDAESRAKKVAKKKFYGEAMKALKEQGAKYKADLGSSAALPQQAQEAIKFQQEFQAKQAESAKAMEAVRSSFVKETDKVLGKDFKGFEVKIGEETMTYKPVDVKKTKEQNLNVNNLLSKFTDKKGNVKDVKGYHKALTFASNPDAIAKHFFDLGKAAAIEQDVKDSKNIQMKPRQIQPKSTGDKPKMKFVDLDSNLSKNAKIKLRNY
ncbi:hypothetical protein PANI_CDS0085 [Maribacter phage Panino]